VGLSTWIADESLVVEGATVSTTVAITPGARALWLRPNNRQVYESELPVQEIDLPAATAAGPADTLNAARSPAA
jgi:hypothetical protein